MKYIKINKDNRITAIIDSDISLAEIEVTGFPKGEPFDYRYINEQYVFDPEPKPEFSSPIRPEEKYVTYEELNNAIRAGVNSI